MSHSTRPRNDGLPESPWWNPAGLVDKSNHESLDASELPSTVEGKPIYMLWTVFLVLLCIVAGAMHMSRFASRAHYDTPQAVAVDYLRDRQQRWSEFHGRLKLENELLSDYHKKIGWPGLLRTEASGTVTAYSPPIVRSHSGPYTVDEFSSTWKKPFLPNAANSDPFMLPKPDSDSAEERNRRRGTSGNPLEDDPEVELR